MYGNFGDARFSGYARFAGPESAVPWRYRSADNIESPAQGHDGTIYALEKYMTGEVHPSNGIPIVETQIIVLDGSTGAVRAKYPLARERRGLGCGANADWQAVPMTIGPVVGNDDHGYVVVRTQWHSGTGCFGEWLLKDVGLSLLRITPAGAVTTVPIYEQHCERGLGDVSICDEPPVPLELVPDGLGGMLVRATYTTSAYWSFGTREYGTERRLTRVTASGVQYHNVVSNNERTSLVGDAGVAFMSDNVSVRAVNVTTAAPIWSNSNLSLVPVVARPDGEVAMQDLSTGHLIEFDAAGTPGTSAPFGGQWGYQSAFGQWVSSETGSLVARKSLAVNAATSSFGGARSTGQNAPTERLFANRETAVLLALEFVYPTSAQTNWEYGGLICHQGNRFVWSPIFSDESQSLVTIPDNLCPMGMAARFHTHPPKERTDPTDSADYDKADQYLAGC